LDEGAASQQIRRFEFRKSRFEKLFPKVVSAAVPCSPRAKAAPAPAWLLSAPGPQCSSVHLGSFGSARCVKPTTKPNAWSLPKAIESVPAASGRKPFDFRKSLAFAKSLVLNMSE